MNLRTLTLISSLALGLSPWISPAAAPEAHLAANGESSILSVPWGTSVGLSLTLEANDQAGQEADWWFVRYDAEGWSSLRLYPDRPRWEAGFFPTYQGPLTSIDALELIRSADISPGRHDYYFGVDTRMNGALDMDSLSYHQVTVQVSTRAELLVPDDFTYLGAFRLPGGDTRPQTFAYGGYAMTYNPDGDSGGGADGFPGSLFIMGHPRLPYGELPDGNQVAEVSIPEPVVADSVSDLPRATFVQGFQNVAAGLFTGLDEIPRNGMEYLNHPATGPRIHLTWGQHFQEDSQTRIASHTWIGTDLAHPNAPATWYIGDQSLYSVNDYLFEIPAAWADEYLGGRPLATGRYRDGGWGGQGPALFAYRPWTDDRGTPAADGSHLGESTLLLYDSSQDNDDVVNHSLRDYQHADEWAGGAWITTPSGKQAVLFAGTKGTGAKYWYGWMNPAGPDQPCVETGLLGQFTLCRQAVDGSACPAEDLTGCSGHNDNRGWWSSRFDARFILYDPGDLVRVAQGDIPSWQPQPYVSIDIDDHLFLNPDHVEEEMLGTGDQRLGRIGSVAYDRARGRLFVLEPFAEGTLPVVHVWQLR